MNIKRDKLVRHLEKISCGGQVKEAVFTKGFSTTALTPDQLLLVIAPSLRGVEPLPGEVGLADLPLVIKSLGLMAGEGNESVDVNVRIEDHRLVIDEQHRGVQRLITASPKTISTRIEAETVDKLKAKITDDGDGVALTEALINGIRNTFTAYKATEVELVPGPDGGVVRVGSPNSHYAEFPTDTLVADEEYTLLFGSHLVDVLAGVSDFSSAVLRLGGPDAVIAVEDSGYTYLLSPRKRSADEAEAPKKGKGKKGSKRTAAVAD